ncbi:hypothetical protein LV82_00874 [Albidovulum inexpectatum]|uniref:Uncharacterized protein n=1 Tax=Albidovulum inexpectatum TaxID=196587 RepID=A0A2S5JJP9_9RHOB|nr:hypothetical protein [Albidovulum inexpectatum]PPB81663.1 hypothetical protein LV82_00874 [Albidovulum inexpectatum]
MEMSLADPKGLIRESYRIDGIGLPECRSIFLDWALSLGPETDQREALRVLLAHYMPGNQDHPMTRILTEALVAPTPRGRRGGRVGRLQQQQGE